MGREAGIPNKNKRGLKARLKQDFDLNVIDAMAIEAKKLIEASPDKLEREGDTYAKDLNHVLVTVDELEKLAQYVEPKLKAVEHTKRDELNERDTDSIAERLAEIITGVPRGAEGSSSTH